MGEKKRTSQELVDNLVNLRRQTNRSVLALSASWGIDKQYFNSLKLYEKRYLQAIAHGRSATKAVLVGRSAARARGMWVVALTGEDTELSGVNGAPSARTRWPHGAIHRRTKLSPDDYGPAFGGVRATTAVRAAIDVARYHGFAEGLIAMDWLLSVGNESRANIERAINAMGRVRNIKTVRRALDHAVNNSDSPYESLGRALLIEHGYRPTTQHKLLGKRVDNFLEPNVCIEYDGDEKYDDETYAPLNETLLAERKREKLLQNQGYVMLRFSPRELLFETPRFIAEVARALQRAVA